MGIFNKLTPEQFQSIGAELDAIRNRVLADLGERDAQYIRGIVRRQRQLEVAGRVMMMIPPAWPLGVAALGASLRGAARRLRRRRRSRQETSRPRPRPLRRAQLPARDRVP